VWSENVVVCSADGLMQLLQDFAAAYQALTQFECQRAIELFGLLPAHHYNTGWVLCHVARAYFELCDYRQVNTSFVLLHHYYYYYFLMVTVCVKG